MGLQIEKISEGSGEGLGGLNLVGQLIKRRMGECCSTSLNPEETLNHQLELFDPKPVVSQGPDRVQPARSKRHSILETEHHDAHSDDGTVHEEA